jgi:hypothetical protein
MVVAGGSGDTTQAGQARLRLRPTRQAKKVLRRRGRLPAAARVAFKPVSGDALTANRSVVFRLKRRSR